MYLSKMPFIFSAAMYRPFLSTGWRRTGSWNILAASIAGIILLCCFTASISRSGSSISDNTNLFEGSCDTSRHLNVALHLLINLVSSAVLASSNYFMQILNAPSRHEIDRAHHTLSSLDIGIPSLKNLRFLSNFKRCFWALLLITSLPIHLMFNSSVYETSFEGSEWQLTIAAEQFLHGSRFFAPGARLAPAGSASPIIYSSHWNKTAVTEEPTAGDEYYSSVARYGTDVEISDYWNESSPINQKLNNITRDIITWEQDHRWVNLTSKACRLEYVSCRPRTWYNDVVVVVETADNFAGWTRTEVYADPYDELPGWKHHIPRDEVNSLWYSTKCASFVYLNDTMGEDPKCSEWGNPEPCRGVLGSVHDYDPEEYQQEEWSITFHNRSATGQSWDERLGYDARFNHLNVKYCMADLAAANRCKVIVANSLILVTLLCVFFKVAICTVIVRRLSAESLVTPGDAIDSFLSEPDPATLALGATDIHDAQRLEFSLPYPLGRVAEDYEALSSTALARKWQRKGRRIMNTLPRESSFGHGGVSSIIQLGAFSFLGGLITANLGQLVLSWSYFVYNALLTRIHVEKELNEYSQSFKPLRVSFPKGEQTVTWRLQLPYRFGVPLLLISIGMHWLVSNSIFLLVKEGAILAIIPIPVSLYKLPGDMMAGGSNSLVLSSMCHAVRPNRRRHRGSGSVVTAAATEMDDEASEVTYDTRSEERLPSGHRHSATSQRSSSELEDGNLQVDDPLVKLAQSRLRWGVTPLTPELRDIVQETGQEALHLTFATEDIFISPPVEGELYL
ncbi:hypothetical protein PG991_011975 [Apiospora marii]|uniref:DUF6536 domain-containing protein n=1 Tax=Apiospora marii TaxID=335849 RepID=A0ABR1RGQ0_9PEZI